MAKKKKTKGDALIDELLSIPKKTRTKKGRAKLFVQLVIYSFIWIGLIVSLFYQNVIDKKLNETNFNFDSAIVDSNYKVHFIDVGQGDCALLQLPDGKNMMIDTGESSSKNNLVRYLDALEIVQIDYLILTHPDSDHIGNAVTIFDMYDVINVYLPPIYSKYDINNNLNKNSLYATKTTSSWSKVVESAYNEKKTTLESLTYNETDSTIKAGEDSTLYTVYIYPPKLSALDGSDSNAYSPFIMVEIGADKFLFTGDADETDEENFLDSHAGILDDLDCSVLKVGHHGSKTSTSERLLSIVKPEYAVISCGKGNSHGHPTQEALDRLGAINGLKIMRTDLEGSIVFGTGGTKIVNQSSYNHVSDLYYEWKYFVICGGVLISIGFVLVINADKKAKEKEERQSKTKSK